jgi:hypothetical protein
MIFGSQTDDQDASNGDEQRNVGLYNQRTATCILPQSSHLNNSGTGRCVGSYSGYFAFYLARRRATLTNYFRVSLSPSC